MVWNKLGWAVLYGHLVLLRHLNCWTRARVQLLRTFVEEDVANRTKFNVEGIRKFEERKEAHELSVIDKYGAFFAGQHEAPAGKGSLIFAPNMSPRSSFAWDA